MVLHLDLFRALTQWIKQNAHDTLWVLRWSFDRPLSISLQWQFWVIFLPFLCVVCCLLHILNNVDFEYFGLAHPHGKNLLFKLTFSLLVQHLIPYYAEIFLASSLSPLHKCSCAALGSVSLAGLMKDTAGSQLPFMCYIRVSMRPHRKSDLRAPLKCFHLLCQNNLDPSVISEFPQRHFAWLTTLWEHWCYTSQCSSQDTHRTIRAVDKF